MNGQAIMTISAAVVALTQFVKWAGLKDNQGPLAVMVLSLIGTICWAWSVGTFVRTEAFDYFAGWISITTSAAGVFGFTRAANTAVSNMKAPPDDGAGSSYTQKP